MELAEAEILGVVDDDGVDAWHVDAALDDGGGEEHVVVVGGEVDDGLLEALGGHLPVGHGDACVGHQAVYHGLELVEALDAVVYDEYLAVAGHLEVDGLAHEVVVERGDGGEDGVAVGRRGIDIGEVAGAHERELQCARYGGGAHGEGVEVDAQLLELLFDGDAEFLLLVDYEQPEVFESDGLADELVGADDDVYLALGQVGQYLTGLLGGAGARQILDSHGKVAQALGEGGVVLEGEHGGGHEHGHLLGVGGGLECGAHGYLGLAEAHVAADEPVHWAVALHVGLDGAGGGELVGGVLVYKGCLQLLLHV